MAGLGISLGIETLQLAFLPRSASWVDILANTVGAAIGAGVGQLLDAALVRRART